MSAHLPHGERRRRPREPEHPQGPSWPLTYDRSYSSAGRAATVAALMFDPRNDLRWTGGITASRPAQPGPLVKGATVERTAGFLGRSFRLCDPAIPVRSPALVEGTSLAYLRL